MQELREQCISTIQQCISAEQHAKQIESTASRQRQIGLSDVRQKHAQMQQDVRNILNELSRITGQAQHFLTELRLKARGGNAITPQAGATSNQLIRTLHNYRAEAKTVLLRL